MNWSQAAWVPVWRSLLLGAALAVAADALAETVPVRYPEGASHAYLALVGPDGRWAAEGEMFQTVNGDRVDSRLVLYFKDGSLHDERAIFSQHGVFTLLKYELTQNGPSFPESMEITLERPTGQYVVRTRTGAERAEQTHSGRLELPADVYNGMLLLLLKNLPLGSHETVHLVVFTPKPQLVSLALFPVRQQTVKIGTVTKQATQYHIKPQLGRMVRWFGRLLGILPADDHYYCWILHDGVPAFVQFEGPLTLKGPIWRLEILHPHLPLSIGKRLK
jgi:hypothetical protein